MKKSAYINNVAFSQNPMPMPVRIRTIPSPIPICHLLNFPTPIMKKPIKLPMKLLIGVKSFRNGMQISKISKPRMTILMEILLVLISFILQISNIAPSKIRIRIPNIFKLSLLDLI